MTSGISLNIAKLDENAFMPTRATQGSVGFDLYSPINFVISPFSRICIPTNLAFHIPEGYYGRIASRSGLVLSKGITAFPGTIDTDFTGNISVILFNDSYTTYYIPRGERIAQFILEKSFVPHIQEINISSLPFTERGSKGFGSSANFYL